MLKPLRFAVSRWFGLGAPLEAVVASALLVLTVSVTNPIALSCSPDSPVSAQGAAEQLPGPPPPAGVPEPSDEDEPPTPFVDSQHPPVDVVAAVTSVTSSDPEAVAEALGLELKPKDASGENAGLTSLEVLGDLDGDNVPELALRWAGLATSPAGTPGGTTEAPEATEDVPGGAADDGSSERPAWIFYVLAWDGMRWNPVRLMETEFTFTVQTQSLLGRKSRNIVAIVQEGANAVPYPVIFEFKNHTATLIWDSRSDESRYQGFADGELEFRDMNGDGVSELIMTGRADPGLLVFTKRGRRGFAARIIYTWDGNTFVPGKIEYAGKEDYTLYRFISALHLHDYRAAYALIDPAKFFKSNEPSVASFQKLVEASWPEFTRDSIFEAREPAAAAGNAFAFALTVEDKNYLYKPSFGPGSKFLLTGLERTEEK